MLPFLLAICCGTDLWSVGERSALSCVQNWCQTMQTLKFQCNPLHQILSSQNCLMLGNPDLICKGCALFCKPTWSEKGARQQTYALLQYRLHKVAWAAREHAHWATGCCWLLSQFCLKLLVLPWIKHSLCLLHNRVDSAASHLLPSLTRL